MPAGTIEHDLELVANAGSDPEHVPNVLEMTELDCNGVKGVNGVSESIGDRFLVLLAFDDIRIDALICICAKHAIPDDEGSGIVLVDAVRIASVVETVSTWSVDDVFEPTQTWNDL